MFSPNLMQQVLNYLVTKPYSEVAPLIAAIHAENEALLAKAKAEAAPAAGEDA